MARQDKEPSQSWLLLEKINETHNWMGFQTISFGSMDENRRFPIPASSFDTPIWIAISSVQAWISELHWIKCANSNNWRYSTSFKSRDIPCTKFPNNFKTWNGNRSNSIKSEPSLTCLKGSFKRHTAYDMLHTPVHRYNLSHWYAARCRPHPS